MSGFNSAWNNRGNKGSNGHVASNGTDLVPLIQSALNIAAPKQPEQQRSRSDESVIRARSYAAAVLRKQGGATLAKKCNNDNVQDVNGESLKEAEANCRGAGGDANISSSSSSCIGSSQGSGHDGSSEGSSEGTVEANGNIDLSKPVEPSSGEMTVVIQVQVPQNAKLSQEKLHLAAAQVMNIMQGPKPKKVDAQVQTDEIEMHHLETQTNTKTRHKGTSAASLCQNRDQEISVKLCSCCQDSTSPTPPVEFYGDAFTFERALSQFVASLGISFMDMNMEEVYDLGSSSMNGMMIENQLNTNE